MEPVTDVVDVEGLGPVVPTSAILHILCGLRDSWIGGDAVIRAIEMVVEIEARCRESRKPMRLVPVIPDRSVCASVETVTYPED